MTKETKKLITFLTFTQALENVEGVTPVAHTVVCIVATLILVPCVFLKDLKVRIIRLNKYFLPRCAQLRLVTVIIIKLKLPLLLQPFERSM